MGWKTGVMKHKVTELVGEEVFYRGNVVHIARNVGVDISKMLAYLRSYAISPFSLGVNTGRFRLPANILLYPRSKIWDYLTTLEAEGVTNLRESGIESFDDIVRLKYHAVH
ncbi:MAG: hypothetical protein WC613_00895 [Candidatus Aenigmatarchaeota archaeon]